MARKTPEDYLRYCQEEEEAQTSRTGRLKIFLGYASGVGKSFRMLDEARRRRERGEDVVVGAMQPSIPAEVEPLMRTLEVIPLRGAAIDVPAIIRRHPAVCIIDGLAYNNPAGLANSTRWEDVRDLLENCIHVIASINIQYIAELREQVEAITGKHVEETVPLAFIQSAGDIEIVDAPPEREGRLSELRELALLVTADIVDQQLNEYLERHGFRQHLGAHEKILVCITPRANITEMMEIAQLAARRFHAQLIVAYVQQQGLSADDRASLESRLDSARAAGVQVEILDGADAADTLLEFARARGITQLFVGHSRRQGLARLTGSPLDKLISKGRGMDVCVFPQ
jgi:two-component system sensor histidine kinase KdpD